MIPDYHLHSSFSEDANIDIKVLIEKAKTQNMTSFCITDHYDKDYPENSLNETFDLDIPSYIKAMSSVKKEYEGSFDLRIGIEMGVMPSTAKDLNDIKTNYPELDFIIASSHIVDNMDPFYPEFFEGRDEISSYRRYFETILENVKLCSNFNVYGHLDYILRYGPTKADNFKINDYLEIFEQIFKIIIPRGQGIEINTGSLYRGLDFSHPHEKTLLLYKELGGEILTFGSDSHDEKHIGYAFDKEAERAKALGFKYYTTYKNMKPSFILL